MAPWGYVIAHNQGAGDAVATAKYDGKPVYHAIVIARPDLQISKWPDDGKGLRISFADVGSTSGWLIPTFWFKSRGRHPCGQRDIGGQWANRSRDRLRSKPHGDDRERRHLAASDQDRLDLGRPAERCDCSARRARSGYDKKGARHSDCDHG